MTEEKRYCNKAASGNCVIGNVKQPLSEFNRARHTRDGFKNICRSCGKAASKKHKDKVRNNKEDFKNMFI